MNQVLSVVAYYYQIEKPKAENLLCESLRKRSAYDWFLPQQHIYDVKVDESVPYKDRFSVTCITVQGNQDKMKSINYPNNFISREYIHWWKDDVNNIRKLVIVGTTIF
jgi:hypothetical protein